MGTGAVLGDLVRGAGRAISSAFDREALNDTFGAKDAYFRMGGKVGERLQQLHMSYQEARAAALAKLDAPVDLAQKQILAHPVLRNKVGLQAPLLDVYKEAQNLKHPIARPGGELDQIIMSSRGNELKSLEQIKNQNVQHARLLASAQVFGPKMEHVIPFVMPLLESKEPLQESWARGAMNLISNETKDTTKHFDNGSVSEVSAAKQAVADKVGLRNKKVTLQAKARGLRADRNELLKPFDTSSTYKRPEEFERRAQNILRVVQLSTVALKHISTVGNLSSIPAPWLVKGLLHMTEPEFKAFLDTTHILAYTDHDFMDRAMRGGEGLTAKLTGNPTAGQIFFKFYHMPFFDAVRTKQLSYAASVGWISAHNWAHQALSGSKIAIANLKEMGISVEDVQRQGGKLTEEQVRKGVFHFVNNRFFMDKTVEQALNSNKDIVRRSATMFHTFVNAQSRFMRRELTKMVKARDYVGLAQFAGTIGVLWPAVAPMVRSLEIFARTANPKLAVTSAKDQYSDLTSGKPSKMLSTYIELLSYYASFGVYTNYVSAAHGDRAAYALAGPAIGTPWRYGSDLINFITRTDKAGKHNAAPIVRDTLEDFIPLAGNIAAHQLVPTAKEEKTGVPAKPQRPRRAYTDPAIERWKF